MPFPLDTSQHSLNPPAYLRALAALVERAPVGMCVLDRHGTYLVVNEALARMNGRTVEAHIGRTVRDIVPDVWARAGTTIAQALETETPLDDLLLEGETASEPGWLRYWRESWFPLPADDTGERLIAIVVREVTAEQRMTRELQAADRRKDEFLATLAHELRGPLAPLAHCVPLLQALADPTAVRIAAIIDRQMRMLTRLVDDLTDASRIRTGKLDLRWENIDLAEVLRDALMTIAPEAEQRRHVVVDELPRAPVGLRGDAIRLRQVFCNLLRNACKFTPAGGRIDVQLSQDGRQAVVRVSDNGVGIPTHRLATIFERLAQADTPYDMRTQGLGIGLWLAREIVERHGGRIEAFSDGTGRGSRFEVFLPLRVRP